MQETRDYIQPSREPNAEPSGSRKHSRRHLSVTRLDRSLASPPNLNELRSFALLSSGRLYISMSSHNQLAAGPLFVSISPGTVSGIRNDSSTRGWLITADGELVSNLLTPFLEATNSMVLLPQNSCEMVPLDRRSAEAAGALCEQISGELTCRKIGWRESSVLLLGRMLIELSRSIWASGPSSGTTRIDIEDLPAYISSHYSEDFSLPELADLCETGSGNLSRTFKRMVGRPLFSYINDIRIEKACGLLKRTTMTVIEVSFAVGYNNVSFFNRYFRKLMGASPSEYRKTSKS